MLLSSFLIFLLKVVKYCCWSLNWKDDWNNKSRDCAFMIQNRAPNGALFHEVILSQD